MLDALVRSTAGKPLWRAFVVGLFWTMDNTKLYRRTNFLLPFNEPQDRSRLRHRTHIYGPHSDSFVDLLVSTKALPLER